MRGRGIWVALGASLALHGGIWVSAAHWPVYPRFPQKEKAPSPPEPETLLIPVEIKRMAAQPRQEIPLNQEFDSAPPVVSAEGSGWHQKIAPPAAFPDEVTYASFIRDSIVRQLVYPPEKKREGLEVAVRVCFILDSRGKIKVLRVADDLRSRHDVFNQAAVNAVKQAQSQFPPFPPFVRKSEQRFSFLLLFRPDMN